jgi:tRNA (mo5U34)-methyltransferase
LRAALMELHPWRKGPLRLGGVTIDSEWRSDWNWRRVARHVELRGHRVLDIGCGNGYFGLRMLGAEDLPGLAGGEAGAFDTVFSMGVLYHRRDHLQHLRRLRSWLRPEGQLVLETLVLAAGQEDRVLLPAGGYARMRNVWAVPGTRRLAGWLEEAGYRRVELLDATS